MTQTTIIPEFARERLYPHVTKRITSWTWEHRSYRVHVTIGTDIAGEPVGGGATRLDAGMIITVRGPHDPVSDYIDIVHLPFPGREVWDPNAQNRIGTTGAARLVIADDLEGHLLAQANKLIDQIEGQQ